MRSLPPKRASGMKACEKLFSHDFRQNSLLDRQESPMHAPLFFHHGEPDANRLLIPISVMDTPARNPIFHRERKIDRLPSAIAWYSGSSDKLWICVCPRVRVRFFREQRECLEAHSAAFHIGKTLGIQGRNKAFSGESTPPSAKAGHFLSVAT